MPQRAIDILNHAKVRFDGWLKRYQPWQSDNHITERNLSLQFILSFLALHEDGLVFVETPVKNSVGTRHDNHLDTYLHSKDFDIVLECKNFWASMHVDAVAADIVRIKSGFSALQQRHLTSSSNKAIPAFGMVLAECWRQDHAHWWGGKSFKKWSKRSEAFPADWDFGYIQVHKHSDDKYGTLFWLYGISRNPME